MKSFSTTSLTKGLAFVLSLALVVSSSPAPATEVDVTEAKALALKKILVAGKLPGNATETTILSREFETI